MTPSDTSDPVRAAALWVTRLHDEPVAPETRAAFERWRAADPMHAHAYDEAERLWIGLGAIEQAAPDRIVAARAAAQRVRRTRQTRRALLGAGALCAAGVLIWIGLDRSPIAPQAPTVEWHTARGERKTIRLPDGSRLDLDADSQVQMRFGSAVRELRLVRGQAAFAVAHGDPRPFEVAAGNERIRDIGTEFGVLLDADQVSVTVRDGAVELQAAADTPAATLTRGERLRCGGDGRCGAREHVDAEAAFAWREGRLVFRGEPLEQVLATLARYHGVRLTVGSPQVAAMRVSGSFPSDDLKLALDTIAATLPVHIVKRGAQDWRIDG